MQHSEIVVIRVVPASGEMGQYLDIARRYMREEG